MRSIQKYALLINFRHLAGDNLNIYPFSTSCYSASPATRPPLPTNPMSRTSIYQLVNPNESQYPTFTNLQRLFCASILRQACVQMYMCTLVYMRTCMPMYLCAYKGIGMRVCAGVRVCVCMRACSLKRTRKEMQVSASKYKFVYSDQYTHLHKTI